MVAFLGRVLKPTRVNELTSRMICIVGIIYPFLNIELPLLLNKFWRIYINFNGKAWSDTVVFSWPKPTFESDPSV